MSIRVAVAGASGYIGAELIRLLLRHPRVELTAVTSERLAGERLDRAYAHLRGLTDLVFHDLDADWRAEIEGFRQSVLALDFWTAYSPTWNVRPDGTIAHQPPAFSGAHLGGLFRMRAYPSQRFGDKAAVYYAACCQEPCRTQEPVARPHAYGDSSGIGLDRQQRPRLWTGPWRDRCRP